MGLWFHLQLASWAHAVSWQEHSGDVKAAEIRQVICSARVGVLPTSVTGARELRVVARWNLSDEYWNVRSASKRR